MIAKTIKNTTRFNYYKNTKDAELPIMTKWLAKFHFGTDDIIPKSERINSYEAYLLECDEAADEVAEELFFKQNIRKGHQQLGLAVSQGIEAVENPTPKFKKLLQTLEQDPVWLDREKLAHGAFVCRRIGMDALIAMGDGALLGGYANPNISKPLSFTGALKGENTFDRVNETTQFWIDVTSENGLEINGKGYQTAVYVRMMHAMVRKRLIQHPKWDTKAWGLPINAADAVATNVGFSSVMLVGSTALGTRHNQKDIESVLHLWKYIGYLMGDKYEWLPNNAAEALQCLFLINKADDMQPDEDSRKLANDFLESFKVHDGTTASKTKSYIEYLKHVAYAEFLIPKKIHRRLSIPSSNFLWLLIPLIHIPQTFVQQNILRKIFPQFNDILEKSGRAAQVNFLKRSKSFKADFKAEKKDFVR